MILYNVPGRTGMGSAPTRLPGSAVIPPKSLDNPWCKEKADKAYDKHNDSTNKGSK